MELGTSIIKGEPAMELKLRGGAVVPIPQFAFEASSPLIAKSIRHYANAQIPPSQG